MSTGLVVPGYFHPAVRPHDWARVREAGHAWACVVVDVADGPGPAGGPPDPAYRALVHVLARAGVTVAGYVDVDYGGRPSRLVRDDVATWLALYGVTAVFLDRYPAVPDAGVASVVAWVRAGGAGLVVANPGVPPDAAAVAGVDVCVTFEGAWEAYRRRADRLRPPLPCSTAHLVHAAPAGVVRQLCAGGGPDGTPCYATPAGGTNPWRALSPGVATPWRGHGRSSTARQTAYRRRTSRTTGGGAGR